MSKDGKVKLSTQPYKGTRDFYPEDFRKIEYIRTVWARVCERFGYEQYDTPILEPMALYASKTSEEIVTKQSFAFEDRGGRMVMMRPEMTPSVSRLVAGRRQESGYPLRLFSMPNCFRYERPQKGREREFWQLNVDIFGVEEYVGPLADAELVLVADKIMQEFGASSDMYEVLVSDRRFLDWLLVDSLKLGKENALKAIRLIDCKAKISADEFTEGLMDLGIDSDGVKTLTDMLKAGSVTELPKEVQGAPFYKDLQSIEQVLSKAQVNYRFDPTIARGFDYYTGFVFEVVDTDPKNNRSMFGGGRYDGLVAKFGVDPIPTTGFAMGDSVLAEMLDARNLWPKDILNKPATDVILIAVGEEGLVAINDFAEVLRAEGKNVAVDYNINRKLDKRVNAAKKLGILEYALVGEDEIKVGKIETRVVG